MKKTFDFNLGIDDVDDINLDDKIKIDRPKKQAPAPAPSGHTDTSLINTVEEKPEAPKLNSA